MGELVQGPLHSRHVAAGAAMGDVGGWQMPLHYGDAEAELSRAREHAAVIDVSCMGRFRMRGDAALGLVERACSSGAARQEDDTASPVRVGEASCVLVRLEDAWVLTCEPADRANVAAVLAAGADELGAKLEDQAAKTTMLQVVGPAAGAVLDRVLPERVSDLPPGAARAGSYMFAKYMAVRTPAASAWSLEVVVPNMLGGAAWDYITRKAGADAISPAGWTTRERILR